MVEVDDVRTLFRESTILFAALVFDLGFSFVGKLLIARYLGRTDFGSVALGVTFLSFLSQILILGLDTGVSRYIPRSEETEFRRAVVLSGFLMALPLSLTTAAALYLTGDWIALKVLRAPEAVGIIPIFALVLPFAVVTYLAIGVVRGLQRAVPGAVIKNVTLPVSRVVLLAVGVVAGVGAVEMSLAYALPFVFAAVVGFYYLWESSLVSFTNREPLMFRELLAFSLPLILSATMVRIFNDVDTFLISYFDATGDVGVYNVVYPSAQLVTSGLAAFGFVFLPLLSKLHAQEKYADMKRIFQLSAKWLLFATLPVSFALAVFPRVFLTYTFGTDYLAGSFALTILVVGFTTHTVMGLNGSALTSIGKTKTIALDNTAVAIVNIVLNLALIPRYSFVGAAIATAVSYSLMNVIYGAQLFRSTGIHPFRRNMLAPVALTTLVGSVYTLALPDALTRNLVTALALYSAFLALYGVSILSFGGIEDEDVMLVNDLEHKLDVDLEPVKRIARKLM